MEGSGAAKCKWLLHACLDTYSYPHIHNMPVVGEAFATTQASYPTSYP